jgi:hypothetical protein
MRQSQPDQDTGEPDEFKGSRPVRIGKGAEDWCREIFAVLTFGNTSAQSISAGGSWKDDPIAHTAQPFTSVGGPGWGSVDYEELMAVVDEAVKRFDFVDPGRLG